jgi:hypothetical protein
MTTATVKSALKLSVIDHDRNDVTFDIWVAYALT